MIALGNPQPDSHTTQPEVESCRRRRWRMWRRGQEWEQERVKVGWRYRTRSSWLPLLQRRICLLRYFRQTGPKPSQGCGGTSRTLTLAYCSAAPPQQYAAHQVACHKLVERLLVMLAMLFTSQPSLKMIARVKSSSPARRHHGSDGFDTAPARWPAPAAPRRPG